MRRKMRTDTGEEVGEESKWQHPKISKKCLREKVMQKLECGNRMQVRRGQ
jgi:hypothetical protein